jgi:hypothetical protein
MTPVETSLLAALPEPKRLSQFHKERQSHSICSRFNRDSLRDSPLPLPAPLGYTLVVKGFSVASAHLSGKTGRSMLSVLSPELIHMVGSICFCLRKTAVAHSRPFSSRLVFRLGRSESARNKSNQAMQRTAGRPCA